MGGIAPYRLALLSFAVLGLAACQTQVIPPGPDVSPRPVEERGRWQGRGATGELGGTLKRYVIVDPKGEVVFYRVEDMAGRWVGEALRSGDERTSTNGCAGGHEGINGRGALEGAEAARWI